MGTWSLQSVNITTVEPYETSELYGTKVVATYRLRYTRSMVGGFTETPRLDWHETIMMNERHKGEAWVFDTNMYAHNPLSRTLEIWAKRYIEAYNHANGRAFAGKGYAKLFDTNGIQVRANALQTKTDPAAKADAVRKYLKDHGGILEMQIHDIPSINKPRPGDTVHKERLLLFNVGVEGGNTRAQAYQYLVVNSALLAAQWTRQHGNGWTISRLNTTGLRSVTAPVQVSQPRNPVFVAGECW
jgi:hypothetical protein